MKGKLTKNVLDKVFNYLSDSENQGIKTIDGVDYYVHIDETPEYIAACKEFLKVIEANSK